jgi:hypothetical protein
MLPRLMLANSVILEEKFWVYNRDNNCLLFICNLNYYIFSACGKGQCKHLWAKHKNTFWCPTYVLSRA